ncbi:MAG: hypothetical protein OZ921_00560 [Sorangiineae bacterium]|nr:hypothetical protein [Polyangiaceae bacterium]MEB2320974.1 hypothetical protein [Sorangiineae bacterium]
MTAEEQARRARSLARRARMVVRKGRLGEAELDFTPVTGAQAISLLTRLCIESFSLAGQEPKAYARESIPVRFVRRSRS